MLSLILANLLNVGIGAGIFLCSYLSNMSFSMWYNIEMLNQEFDAEKVKKSALKVLAFCVGATLLCLAITTLPVFATEVGWEIPVDYQEVFSNIVIIGVFLLGSCKYIKEAYEKMKIILFEKIPETIDNVDVTSNDVVASEKVGYE